MTERKRPRRTRERILETSLTLFNRFGEPHVTTGDIAVEMGISPGNLYYHFRNKDEISAELYAAFETDAQPLLARAGERRVDVEDLWLWLHLWLEAMLRHRFLFRDVVDLTSRNRVIGLGMARLLREGTASLRAMFDAMHAAGDLEGTSAELDALSRNAMLIVTHSMAHARVLRGPGNDAIDPDLNEAAYQVLTSIAPHLTGDARALLARLSREYVAHTSTKGASA